MRPLESLNRAMRGLVRQAARQQPVAPGAVPAGLVGVEPAKLPVLKPFGDADPVVVSHG